MDAPETKVSYVATTPKPRLMKLAIRPQREDTFTVAGVGHRATHYDVKVEIGGVAGAVAPVLGKQPKDIHVWILGGKAPAFVRMDGQLYEGGPVWRIELTSPVWPVSTIRTVCQLLPIRGLRGTCNRARPAEENAA